jgi:hypothetical protein
MTPPPSSSSSGSRTTRPRHVTHPPRPSRLHPKRPPCCLCSPCSHRPQAADSTAATSAHSWSPAPTSCALSWNMKTATEIMLPDLPRADAQGGGGDERAELQQ